MSIRTDLLNSLSYHEKMKVYREVERSHRESDIEYYISETVNFTDEQKEQLLNDLDTLDEIVDEYAEYCEDYDWWEYACAACIHVLSKHPEYLKYVQED